MQRLAVPFILVMLGVLAVPTSSRAQEPLPPEMILRLVPLTHPDEAHSACVPKPGADIRVMAEKLDAPRTRVTELFWDRKYGRYVIEVSGGLRLAKEIHRCVTRLDISFLWRRVGVDGNLAEETALVFPWQKENSNSKKLFKEA